MSCKKPVMSCCENNDLPANKNQVDAYVKTIQVLQEQILNATTDSYYLGVVLYAENKLNTKAFEKNDLVLILDPEILAQCESNIAVIESKACDNNGNLKIKLSDGQLIDVNIGLNGNKPQVRLLNKNDGTLVKVSINDQVYMVHGLSNVKLQPGDVVAVNPQTSQIQYTMSERAGGIVATVLNLIDKNQIEVSIENTNHVCYFQNIFNIQVGDKVLIDSSKHAVIRLLPKEENKYSLHETQDVFWDNIAGLDDAKNEMAEVLEHPYEYPELYSYYSINPARGILLYGPPGCGKTLIAKAASNSLARTHGKSSVGTGFIYVKGPELLNMYVGNSESNVRLLFEKARKHYREHSYPAIIFIDEADSLLGTRQNTIEKGHKVDHNVVNQFLAEMDGLEQSHAIVLLATNQSKSLDPAIVRPGRIDRKVYIGRPSKDTAGHYFDVHMKNLPIHKSHTYEELKAFMVEQLYAPRPMYKITSGSKTEVFHFYDMISGAIIAGLIDMAKQHAIRRDRLTGKKPTGLKKLDFEFALEKILKSNNAQDHKFDLEDYCEHRNISSIGSTIVKIRS